MGKQIQALRQHTLTKKLEESEPAGRAEVNKSRRRMPLLEGTWKHAILS